MLCDRAMLGGIMVHGLNLKIAKEELYVNLYLYFYMTNCFFANDFIHELFKMHTFTNISGLFKSNETDFRK